MSETLETKRNNILIENNAKTIFDHLTELTNNSTNHERRWFWELLQNAKDSTTDSIDVKLKITDNEVVFSHNGNTFSEEDILHIIYHGSTKAQLEGKTGKFGTGFLTTHLLSKKVEIEGYIDNGKYFNFLMDRTANDEKELKAQLDSTYANFKKIFDKDEQVELGDFKTLFKYHISKQGLIICQKGVRDLKKIAPFVLAFNNTINSIEIDDNTSIWLIRRIGNFIDNFPLKGIQIEEQESVTDTIILQIQNLKTPEEASGFYSDNSDIIDDSKYEKIFFEKKNALSLNQSEISKSNSIHIHNVLLLIDPENGFDLGIPLIEEDAIDILQRDIPRLFLDFPLFGTENLGIPFIINTKLFHPLKERTGIYLNTTTEESILAKENKEIINNAFAKYITLVEKCKENGIENLEYLLNFQITHNYDWNDTIFTNNCIVNAIDFLTKLPIINSDTTSDENEQIFYSLDETHIPVSTKGRNVDVELLFSLTADLNLKGLPSKERWEIISKIRNNWPVIDNKYETLECDWTVNKLLLQIQVAKTIDGFIGHWKNLNEQTFYQWINGVFHLLKKSSFTDVLQLINCIPNQEGIFKKIEVGSLFFDEIKNDELKSISLLSDYNIHSLLIHEEISEEHKDLFIPKKIDELLNYLIDIFVNRKSDFAKILDADKNPLIQIFDWGFKNAGFLQQILNKVPFIFTNTDDEQIKFEPRLLNKDEKVLVPSMWWPKELEFYSQIVSPRFLVSSIYNTTLDESRIEILKNADFFYTSPIYEEEQILKRDEAVHLTDQNDTIKLLDCSEELKIGSVKLSKLAWFETGDKLSVFNRIQSKKRTQTLIEFLLNHLIKADNSWTEKIPLSTSPDLKISVIKSLWLCRLNTNGWVWTSVGSQKPSSSNISYHLKEMGYSHVLKDNLVTKFLNALKIPVSDVIKQVLLKNEDEGNAWDSVYASMLQGKVEAKDVNEMLQDDDVIEFYRRKKLNTEIVRRNQSIGFLFEKLLKNMFESDEYKLLGFKITRAPIGSDFLISITDTKDSVILEEDILNKDCTEESLFILESTYKIFIELKATSGNGVSMTRVQARKAVENRDNYCLVIFKYTDESDITIDSIKESSIFIDEIGKDLIVPLSRQSKTQQEIELEKTGQEIVVDSEYGNVRFRVNKPVWEKGKTLKMFIDDLIRQVQPAAINA